MSIEPDVITLPKGLGGGVPIGVVMTSLIRYFFSGRPRKHFWRQSIVSTKR